MTLNKKVLLFFISFALSSCALFERKTIYNSPLEYGIESPSKKAAFDLVEDARELLAENRLDEAKRILEKTITIDYQNPYSYYFLGVIALLENKHKKSVGFFKKSLTLMPSSSFWLSQIYKGLGIAYFNLNMEKTALEHFEKSLKFYSSEKESREYIDRIQNTDH